MVKIVTDSTCDLSQEALDSFGISFVPLNVHFGKKQYRDKIDLTPEMFYKKLSEEKVHPSTSQPSPADFETYYRECGREGEDILSIHISSKLSGTIQSANIASNMTPELDVQIFDSKSASVGLGLMVRKAAKMAQEGLDRETIVEELKKYREQVTLYFLVDTLEYLQKGGRIGKAQAIFGSLMGIKPILTLRDGEIVPKEKVRSKKKAINRMYELLLEDKSGEKVDVAIFYSNVDEPVDPIKKYLESQFQCQAVMTGLFGPVIGVHLGPGAIGICMV